MYRILGTYQGTAEEIDRFDTKVEATKMLAEYVMAFGAGWSLKIRRVR